MLDWKNQFNDYASVKKAIVWRPLMSDHISPKAAHAVHVTTSESQSPYIWTEESFCAFYLHNMVPFASSGPCLEENCYLVTQKSVHMKYFVKFKWKQEKSKSLWYNKTDQNERFYI